MEKKKTKGFFNILFAPKSKSGCCNIEFEEIPVDEISTKEQDNLDLTNENKSRKKITKE